MAIPKRESQQMTDAITRYQKIISIAKARDLNESDTVTIISDMLNDIFGYDKYIDITSEFAIRNTYCDIAIKIGNKIEYLIECKSIGTELKDSHLKQAIDYGANQGVSWVILTNGAIWKLYKIRFEKPINFDLVLQFDFTQISARAEETKELLYILHKGAIEKNLRQMHFEKTQLVNQYTIAQLLLSEPITNAIKREIRRLSDIKLDDNEIKDTLQTLVIKRDLIESEEAKNAEKTVRKLQKAVERKSTKKTPASPEIEPTSSAPIVDDNSADNSETLEQ
jgi:hypothetical protein